MTLTSTAGGYGLMLLQSLCALAAFGVIAWILVRWSSGTLQRRSLSQGHVHVLERIPLDARRFLYLVRCGDRVLLLGASDNAGPHVLTEFAAESLPHVTVQQAQHFGTILQRLRSSGSTATPTPSESTDTQKESS